MSYAERTYRTDADGLRVFSTEEDHQAEDRAAEIFGKAYGWTMRRFEHFDPIDWRAAAGGKTVAVVELKTRSHPSDRYPTVWLNLRKYLALWRYRAAFEVPAYFAAQFTDGLRVIEFADIDATKQRMGGCAAQVKARNDREMVIEIPVERMTCVPTP